MTNQRAYLIAYYATLLVVGLMAGALGPAMPSLASATQSSLAQVSVILAMRPGGYLAGTLLAGRLLDRVPGHPLLIAALALAAAAFALSPLMPALSGLALMILFLGFADGILDVGANTLLPWVYGDKSGPYFNGLHFVFGLGALSAPLIIERSLQLSGGIRWGFWAMGLCMLPVMLALKRIPSPAQKIPEADRAQGGEPLGLVLLIVLIFLAYGGSEAAFGNWIFSYAKARQLADDSSAAYLNSLFWGTLTLGRLVAIPLALRLPQRRILAFNAGLALLSLALLLTWPQSRPMLWIATVGAGLGMSSFFPTLVSFSGKVLSPDGRVSGKIVSLFFVGSSCGAILIPWLIGQGFEAFGPTVVSAVIFAALLILSYLLAALLKRHKPLQSRP